MQHSRRIHHKDDENKTLCKVKIRSTILAGDVLGSCIPARPPHQENINDTDRRVVENPILSSWTLYKQARDNPS